MPIPPTPLIGGWLLASVTLALLTSSGSATLDLQTRASYTSVCQGIESAVSSASSVNFPGDLSDLNSTYWAGIYHWANSSTQYAACSVEPGTAEDVGAILRMLGDTRTPFAVKGGGHASNPGFSSTEGVQIAMSRFNKVTYDAQSGTATVGAGLVWDEVYAALEPYSVNVVGGRASGIGVAGFTLGGGFSFKTNQYGLTLDTVRGFQLVLPDGTVTMVSETRNPDLMWALKGGFNNFGIVTQFTFETHPQTDVWGGQALYAGEDQLVEAIMNATIKFTQTVTDPKAAILPTFNFAQGTPVISLLLFYDGPNPPAGMFDDFLNIPNITRNVTTRKFTDLIALTPASSNAGLRDIFHTVSLHQFSEPILAAVWNETKFWGAQLANSSATFISYDVEPFLPSIFSHSPELSSAYPPSRATALLPLNIYHAYTAETADQVFWDAVKQSAAHLTNVALADGQNVANAALYPNYAIFDTDLAKMYGYNVGLLRAIKQVRDPHGVMSLAGGFKF